MISFSNQAPCNSFPKVFGGAAGDALVYQFDAFGDYLAIAGTLYDSSLTTVT
jgi:hypothetical protein